MTELFNKQSGYEKQSPPCTENQDQGDQTLVEQVENYRHLPLTSGITDANKCSVMEIVTRHGKKINHKFQTLNYIYFPILPSHFPCSSLFIHKALNDKFVHRMGDYYTPCPRDHWLYRPRGSFGAACCPKGLQSVDGRLKPLGQHQNSLLMADKANDQ